MAQREKASWFQTILQRKYARPSERFGVVLLLLFLVLFSTSGCSSFSADALKSIDLSHHTDGSRMTKAEVAAYQKSILSTLLITEKDGNLTGTHTGLFSTVVSITLYNCTDRALLNDCFSLLAEYETILSRTMPGSELYAINQNTSGSATISDTLAEVLALGLSYHTPSKERFDITIAPLSDLWAFNLEVPTVPSAALLANALAHVNASRVTLNDNLLTYPAGTSFDLGAVAKGWLSDQIAVYLRESGIERAMINLGGNTLAVGEKADGSAYRVGITLPFSASSELAGIVSVKNKSVVTSGIYERYFLKDDKLYHHILDATTGYPIENDLLSVTIVCENSALADVLSTVCFLLGKEDGLALINERNTQTEVYALFLTGTYDVETKTITDLEYHFSEGFEAGTGFEKSQP